MTVRELIFQLLQVEQDRLVILPTNGVEYSPLVGLDDNSVYQASTPHWGTIGLQELTQELETGGFTEQQIGVGVPSLVLFSAE